MRRAKDGMLLRPLLSATILLLCAVCSAVGAPTDPCMPADDGHLFLTACASAGVTVASPLPLNLRSWSICLWFQLSELSPASHTVYSLGTGSDYTAAERELFGLEFSVTEMQFNLGTAGGPETLSFTDVTRSSVHLKWTQVCVTLLSERAMGFGNGQLTVYAKGSPFPQTSTNAIDYRGADSVSLRGFSDGVGAMDLRIDNWMMWDRALTAVEIAHGFATGGWTPSGLKAHWPFNEQVGNTAFDTVSQTPFVLTATPCARWGGTTVSDGHAVLSGAAVASVLVPLNSSTTGRPALKLTGKDFSVCMWTRLSTSAILASTAQSYFSLGTASTTPARRGGSIRLGYDAGSPDAFLVSAPPFVDFVSGSGMKGVDAGHWSHKCLVWRGTANGTRPSRASSLQVYENGGLTSGLGQSSCASSLIGTGTNFCNNLELWQQCAVRCVATLAPNKGPPTCDQVGAAAPALSHTPACAALSWTAVGSNTNYSQSTSRPWRALASFVVDTQLGFCLLAVDMLAFFCLCC